MTQLTILTGASRGMGLAMAEQLCTPNHTLLCISRGNSDALEALAKKNGTTLLQWQADLAQPEAVANKLMAWLQKLEGSTFSQASLINNAGVIGHLGPIEQASPTSVQQALAINLAAPILLTQVFLQATRRWPAKRKVLQISSGLGRRAMAASAVYCASKFGLRGFTQALRRELGSSGIRVRYFAPRATKTTLNSPAVVAMNEALNTQSDTVESVAEQFVDFFNSPRNEQVLGWPERLFVFINRLRYSITDQAIGKQLKTIERFLPR
jgi:short-subunit dehydrogenase